MLQLAIGFGQVPCSFQDAGRDTAQVSYLWRQRLTGIDENTESTKACTSVNVPECGSDLEDALRRLIELQVE
jgi:hypothetical protein